MFLFFMLIFTFILVFVLCFYMSAQSKKGKTAIKKNSTSVTYEDVHNKILSMTNEEFISLGWDEWDYHTHEMPGQYQRMEKAATSKIMKLIDYDTENETAKIMGDSGTVYDVRGNGCNCQDFIHRHLPCKHMYFLAMELSD